MCDKTEIVKRKTTAQDEMLRKQDKPLVVSNSSYKRPLTLRSTRTSGNSNTSTPRYSIETGRSIFSKRNQINQGKPATAPTSTTVLDRRLISNNSSASHKPGQIPAYLRSKTCNKNIVAVQMQSNKKQFVQIKKELDDLQNKAVGCYNRYKESLVKLNKLNGNVDPLSIEEIQIVGFNVKSVSATTSPIVSTTELNLVPNHSFSKIKPITDEKVLSNISRQVHEIQVHSFKLLQEFSDCMSLLNKQMKLTNNSEGGDSNLFPAKIQRLFEDIEKKILEEETQQNTRIINFMNNLKQIMISDEEIPPKESVWDEYENYRKNNEHRDSEFERKTKDMELKQIHPATNNALDAALIETKNKEIDRLLLKLNQVELSNKRLEMQLEEKTVDEIAKVNSIVELQTLIKSMQEKVIKHSTYIEKLENKLVRTSEEYRIQIDGLKQVYDEEVRLGNVLRCQVNELNLGMTENSRAVRDENMKLKNIEYALKKENDGLKQSLQLNQILSTKTANKRSKTEENQFRRESERRDEELTRLNNTITEMKEELFKRDILVKEKTQQIVEMARLIKKLENSDQIQKFQEEIARLQELATEKSKEIEQLQRDLGKTEAAFRRQEESLHMQQRLLKIRSDLIKTLQENEDSTKKQFAELNSELERMAYAIKQVKLNQEITTKTEALENLFTVKGVKKFEVKRQDQIINMLEETHERNQKFRVHLEDKIARLEQENAEMKRFMSKHI